MIDKKFYELPIFECEDLEDLKYALSFYENLYKKNPKNKKIYTIIKYMTDTIDNFENNIKDKTYYIGLRAFKTVEEPRLENELKEVELDSLYLFAGQYWTNFVITPEAHGLDKGPSISIYELFGMKEIK